VRILRKELLEISAHIQQTRNEIAALHPDDKGASSIVHATSELDAIVSATERATYDILNGAERIQAAAAKLPAAPEVSTLAAEIGKQATDIMTACSFQDLTGQRISKVVNALRYIETRINAMIEIWGIDEAARAAAATAPADDRPDAHLLNGPQLEGAADQSEIDSLFEAAPAPPSDEGAVDATAQ
jgi:chemotaxis regulatin CheY-phosphate phosphatase CheZ